MQLQVKEQKTEVKEIYVAPCLKCGGEDIRLGDCGYSSFNEAYGKCSTCGNKIGFICGLDISIEEVAKEWNKSNDIDTLVSSKNNAIELLKKEISELKAVKKQRKTK